MMEGPHGHHHDMGHRRCHEPMGMGMFYRPRYRSYLSTGLSALIGAAIGTKIASNTNTGYNSANNTGNNYYEVFSYCPSCGAKNNGNSRCSSCGYSLVK
jgi:hypothetical protein